MIGVLKSLSNFQIPIIITKTYRMIFSFIDPGELKILVNAVNK